MWRKRRWLIIAQTLLSEGRKVFNRRRLERLHWAVAFDMGTVKYSQRSLLTSLKRDCVSRPCAASMSVIVATFVTRLFGLPAELLCACKTAGNIDSRVDSPSMSHVYMSTTYAFDWCDNVLFDWTKMCFMFAYFILPNVLGWTGMTEMSFYPKCCDIWAFAGIQWFAT